MADIIQHRRDTKANWSKANPILMEGEIGYVIDDPNLYKMGDGEHTWSELPYRGFDGTLASDLESDSEQAAASVAAVNKYLNKHKFVTCTTEEYKKMLEKDDKTVYFCTEGEEVEEVERPLRTT